MNKIFAKITIILLVFLALASCSSSRVVDVKSPCVSNEDGPCGPRRSVNAWWLENNANS